MTCASRVLEDVVAHARQCQPRECCGMLVGDVERIVASVRARNLAESPSRFLIDPRDHFAALRTARAQGLEIVGFYHSHPHSEAHPSATDVAEAAYPACVHVIVGLSREPPEVRLFKLGGDSVEELQLTVDQ